MKRVKKVLLLSLAVLVVVITAASLFVRFYFTDERLRNIAEPLLEEQLNRDVSIDGFSIQLLRSFPNLSVGIHELAIHTPPRNESPSPDLASVDRIWVDVPLMPLLQSKVIVKSLEVDSLLVLVEVYDDLSSNLIEVASGDNEAADTSAASSEAQIQEIALENIQVKNAQLGYLHADGTVITIADLDADMALRLAETLQINGQIEIEDAFVEMGGIQYADQWSLSLDLDAEAHLDSTWLRIQTADLQLEELLLQLTGSVENWDSERIGLDLTFDAPNGSVAGFWSLLPVSITRDISGLESEGQFAVHATIKGDMVEGELPEFHADLQLRDGVVHYPDLPSSIRNLFLDAKISNDRVTLNRLSADADGANLKVEGSLSEFAQPVVQADIYLNTDLSQLKTYYPLDENDQLEGRLEVDSRIQGPLEQTDVLSASGTIVLADIFYSSSALEQPVENLSGQIQINDDALSFNELTLNTGQSDLKINGSLSGYRAFIADSIYPGEEPHLEGIIQSDGLYLTEQMSADTSSSFVGPLELPPLTMDVSLEANTIEFNGFLLDEAQGNVVLNEGVIGFESISARFFGGLLSADGRFDVSNALSPSFDGSVSLGQIPVVDFFSSLSEMDSFLRLGAYLDGLFDSQASFALAFDKDLNPVYQTILAEGLFGARNGAFGTTPLQEALASYTGLAAFESLSFQDWSHAFNISGERIHVQNLEMSAGDYSLFVDGSQEFDGTMDYRFTIELPESASNALNNSPIQGALSPLSSALNVALVEPSSERVTLDLLASGAFSDPQVRLNTDMMEARFQSRASALAEGARQEAQARLDSLEQQARDRAEAELAEQQRRLEEEATDQVSTLVGELVDSTVVPTNLDSLKDKGVDEVKDRLKGLLKRKKN